MSTYSVYQDKTRWQSVNVSLYVDDLIFPGKVADIMFVVRLSSRYMENPTELHLQAVTRVLRREEILKMLLTLIVSNYAGGLADRRSTSCYQEYLKGVFLNGLREEMKAELKLHPAGTLSELMNNAQMIDEKKYYNGD
ncbi:hypothetical protein SESBI_23431 [Sesbania bispinosa]|nr:hypothetical protein SESBI_23431 [Sesbania bispinosa]